MMKLSRRTLAILAASALAASATWAQTKVTIYSAAPQDLLDRVIPAFEKASGAKVDLIKGGSGDLINRLRGERGRQTADVLFSVSTEVILANAALFTPYTPDNAKSMAEAFRIQGAAVPFTAVATSVGVNTKLLTPAQYPRTWQDLANPALKGKISMARVDKSGSSFIQLATVLQLYGEDKGWDLYKRIMDNSVLSNSSGAVPKFVNDGEAAVGVSNEDTLLKFKVGGGPVELLYPADGTSASADVMALSATPANAEGGKAFINFMLSKPAQELVAGVGRRPVRPDVASSAALTPLSQIKLIAYDQVWAGENRTRILRKWNDLLIEKK